MTTKSRGRGPGGIRATNGNSVPRYDRSRLSSLIPIDIARIAAGPEATAVLVQRLVSALRSQRAQAGRGNYDLNRHVGLLQAHAAECARLAIELKQTKK